MNQLQSILEEIGSVLEKVNIQDIRKLVDIIQGGKRVFVVGEGRSGLMAKSFAMRLMHLGATVYVVGETITPAMEKGDVLVAISGSGTTKNVIWVAKKAAELECPVVAMTTNPESELGMESNFIVHVPAATKYGREGEKASIQPLGSLFDQCAHIVFDTTCLIYASVKSENNDGAFARHSNLE